uniref:Uncharacterized protein n=1 Tax=Clastoptera arizonana TaxID=38151 RepID=A0A1B6BXB9_9HEMI
MDQINDRLKDVFQLFQEFFDFLQQNIWCENLSGTDVTNVFTKAIDIESFCALIYSLGLEGVFNVKLKEFWSTLKKENGPDLIFFRNATELTLKKYLTYEKFDKSTVKLSIDVYLKNNSKDKLISVIQDTVQSHQMCSRLCGIIMKNINKLEIESRVIFENWIAVLNLKCESYEVIHKSVINLLNTDIKNAEVLFKILCIKNKSRHSCLIKDVVLENLVALLESRFVKEIWIIFLNVEENDFKYLLNHYSRLSKSIYKIIEFSAHRLKIVYCVDSYSWLSFEECLEYSELLTLLRKFKNVGNEIEKDLIEHMLSMKSTKFCVLYEDLLRDINKSTQ